jgi:hypothetical protein
MAVITLVSSMAQKVVFVWLLSVLLTSSRHIGHIRSSFQAQTLLQATCIDGAFLFTLSPGFLLLLFYYF